MKRQSETSPAAMVGAYPFAQWLAANGIPRSTGYDYLAEGRIRTFKLGRRRYVSAADAAQFFADAQAAS